MLMEEISFYGFNRPLVMHDFSKIQKCGEILYDHLFYFPSLVMSV